MTEEEWVNSTDPMVVLETADLRVRYRKRRLLTSALCRLIWEQLPLECRDAIEQSDSFADHPVARKALDETTRRIWNKIKQMSTDTPEMQRDFNIHIATVYTTAVPSSAYHVLSALSNVKDRPQTPAYRCDVIRDIFGNPFRPVAADPAWLSSDVVALASAIYDERAFDRLPILADALEEAGCDHADVLAHCRGPGPHVRGCWVVDLLLGKS